MVVAPHPSSSLRTPNCSVENGHKRSNVETIPTTKERKRTWLVWVAVVALGLLGALRQAMCRIETEQRGRGTWQPLYVTPQIDVVAGASESPQQLSASPVADPDKKEAASISSSSPPSFTYSPQIDAVSGTNDSQQQQQQQRQQQSTLVSAADPEKNETTKISPSSDPLFTYSRARACLLDSPYAPPAAALPKKPLTPSKLEAHYRFLLAKTQSLRTIPVHPYAGYNGPWIENHWISKFCCNRSLADFGGLVPIFVQWVDLWAYYGPNGARPQRRSKSGPLTTFVEQRAAGNAVFARRVKSYLFDHLRPDVLYVTLSHYDGGIHTTTGEITPHMTRNILVLSGGGVGHVPVPLLMKELPLAPPLSPPLQFDVSFVGKIRPGDMRERMSNEFKACRVASQHNRTMHFGYFYTPEWKEVMAQSLLNLTPRGMGRTSFHLYETIQMGYIPIHVWDDLVWLPYKGSAASAETFGFTVNVKQIPEFCRKLSDALAGMDGVVVGPSSSSSSSSLSSSTFTSMSGTRTAEIKLNRELGERRARLLEYRDSHYTFEGMMQQVEWYLVGDPRSDLRCQRHPLRLIRESGDV